MVRQRFKNKQNKTLVGPQVQEQDSGSVRSRKEKVEPKPERRLCLLGTFSWLGLKH